MSKKNEAHIYRAKRRHWARINNCHQDNTESLSTDVKGIAGVTLPLPSEAYPDELRLETRIQSTKVEGKFNDSSVNFG